MSIKMRVVRVRQVPTMSSAKQGRAFLREIQGSIEDDRPHIVLDCSNVRQLDRPVVFLLLCCLEEVMKCNGDVKLAALPAGSTAFLEMNGIGHLFDVYKTTAEAVNSFQQFPGGIFPHAPGGLPSQQKAGSAA